MTTLTTAHYADQMGPRVEPDNLTIGLSAGAKLFVGGLAATSSGYLVTPTAVTGLQFWGVISKDQTGLPGSSIDNTSGANSDRDAVVARGVFKFDNYVSDPVTVANVGSTVYCVDSTSVARTDGSGTRSPCGTLYQVDSDGVWVQVGQYNTTYAVATRTTDGSQSAADKLFEDHLRWPVVNLTDASSSQAISGGTYYLVPSSVPLTTQRVVTVVSGGAVSGDQITISRQDVGSGPLAISAASTGILAYIRSPGFVDLQFGTEWAIKRKGMGQRLPQSVTMTSGSATSVAISSGMFQKIPALSANTTITVVSGGAVSGDEMVFTRQVSPSAHTVAISSGSGSGNTLCTLVASKAGVSRIRFDGLDWELVVCGNVG